jgi:hypothetical protein
MAARKLLTFDHQIHRRPVADRPGSAALSLPVK